MSHQQPNNNNNNTDDLDRQAQEEMDALLGGGNSSPATPSKTNNNNTNNLDPNLLSERVDVSNENDDDAGSPTTDQLVDEALPSSAGSPYSMAGDDEDAAFDAIVGNNITTTNTATTNTTTTSTSNNNNNNASAATTSQQHQDPTAIESNNNNKIHQQNNNENQEPTTFSSNLSFLLNNDPQSGGNDDPSVSEEERLLQSIVSSLDETQGVLGEITSDSEQVESALEAAIRNAVSGKSSLQAGHTVVQLKEMHGIVTELRNAKSSVGHISCITCQESPNYAPQRLCLLVGTTSSLVLLFDTRQKLLGVCGTTADAKGEVTALSSSADGGTFVAGYSRLAIIIWNSETFEPVRTLQNEATSIPLQLGFFRPDHEKFFCVTKDELRFFSTAKIMGKLIFRSSRFEGIGIFHNTDPKKPMIRMSDAAVATLPDPTAPAGSNDLRYYYAVATHQELIIGSVDFGVTSTKNKIEYRRDLRMQMSLVDTADSSSSYASRRSFVTNSSSAASSPRNASASGIMNIGALVQWKNRKVSSSLSLFVTDGTSFETYALIQTQNDTSVSVVQLNRMEVPNPIRTLNCLEAGCALLGDTTEYIHVVDPATSKMIESVQGSAGFDLIRRGGPLQVHGSFTDSGGATYFCSQDRVACCNVLSWEARIEALIFLRRWVEALELTRQFICSDDVTAVGLVDEKGMKNTESVRAYAEQTLVPALLTDGLRNPSKFTKLLDDTMDFCQAVGLLTSCLPEMKMFCQTIEAESDFYLALEALLSRKDCRGIPENILMSFAQYFANLPVVVSSDDNNDNNDHQDETTTAKEKVKENHHDHHHHHENNSDNDDSVGDGEKKPKLTGLERLQRCLMHVVGSDEVILKLAKQYKLWHAVMVVWSVRRQRPDVVIIELSGVADTALVSYLSSVIDGFTPDGETPSENSIDARRKIIAVLAAQPSALRKIAAIPGFLEVMNRAMTISNLWQHDPNIPRHLGPLSPPCDKSTFLVKLDQAIEANHQQQQQQQQQQSNTTTNNKSKDASSSSSFSSLLNQFMFLWAQEVACGRANVTDPETFFSRVLMHCNTTTSIKSSSSHHHGNNSNKDDNNNNNNKREQLQSILCDLILLSPSFVKARLNDLEKQLMRVHSTLPRVHATLLVRQLRFKDALDIFFEQYAQFKDALLAAHQAHQHQKQGGGSSSSVASTKHHHHHSSPTNRHPIVGDMFQFMENILEMIENPTSVLYFSSSSSSSSPNTTNNNVKEQFTNVVKESIPRLIGINSSKLARFVSSHMSELQPFVLKALPSDSKEQCEFLKEFLDRPMKNTSAQNKRLLQTRLLILMCQYDAGSLYSYLVERDSSIEFDIEPVLRAAQNHNITEACAFLFEKTCQIFEAMKLLIQALAKSIQEHWLHEKQRIQAKYQTSSDPSSKQKQQQHIEEHLNKEFEKIADLVTKTFTTVRDSDSLLNSSSSNSNNNNNNMNSNNSISGGTNTNTNTNTFNNNNHRHRRDSIASNSSTTSSTTYSTSGNSSSSTLETIHRLLTAGIGLCRRHAQKIDPNELRQAWFTLLDLFAKPKRSFQKRLDLWRKNSNATSASPSREPSLVAENLQSSSSSSSFFSNKDDFPELSSTTGDLNAASSSSSGKQSSSSSSASFSLTTAGLHFHVSMLKFFVELSTIVLAHMVQELDLKEVIEKIVQDSEQESYASLKPVIVGILDLLRFELTSNDLCRMCACNDVVHLTDELHHLLGRAMNLKGIFCWLCQGHLRRGAGGGGSGPGGLNNNDASSPSSQSRNHHSGEEEKARIFHCGHAFHESCVQGQAECPQCVAEKTNSLDALLLMKNMKMLDAAESKKNIDNNNNNNKDADNNNLDENNNSLDPQRCLRQLRIIRQKLDAAGKRRVTLGEKTSSRMLTLSPPPRFGGIADQEQPTSTMNMHVVEINNKKILPRSAYTKVSNVPPSLLKEEEKFSMMKGGGGGSGNNKGEDLDW